MSTIVEEQALPAAPAAHSTRPFYWSVRRELWENRSLYFAPLAAAGVLFIGFLLNAVHLPQGVQALGTLDPDRQRAAVSGVYGGVGVVVAMVMAITAWFYALDALYSERRDRSILFWKSLPVSDSNTVLAKLFTAMAIAPAIAFVVILALQLLLLLLSSVVLLLGGASPAPIWSNLQLFHLTGLLVYSLIVLSLWYAPVYAWLLFVSAWAKKSTFLWAVLPPIAVVVFERIAFHSNYTAQLLGYRLSGGLASGYDAAMMRAHERGPAGVGAEVRVDLPDHALELIAPLQFLANIWLWVGLLAAAALTAAAIWMRRYREPI